MCLDPRRHTTGPTLPCGSQGAGREALNQGVGEREGRMEGNKTEERLGKEEGRERRRNGTKGGRMCGMGGQMDKWWEKENKRREQG